MTQTQNIEKLRKTETHHETLDDYFRVVAHLNDLWRVIESCDGLLWILQNKRGKRCGRPRWTGRGYFATCEALVRVSHIRCGEIEAKAASVVHGLPDSFPRHHGKKA